MVTYILYQVAGKQESLITSSLDKENIIEQAKILLKDYPDWHLIVKDRKGKIYWSSS